MIFYSSFYRGIIVMIRVALQIFTEPMYLDDYYFKNFYNYKIRGNWKVGVYSYYYVYKYVADPRYSDYRLPRLE